MNIGPLIALLITCIVTLGGTVIFAEMDRASRNPAPVTAYLIFFAVLLSFCLGLFYWAGFFS